MDRSVVITLVKTTETTDSDGYVVIAETSRNVFGRFKLGVNRMEFYEAQKSGVQLSATITIWGAEYDGERLLEVNGHRYSIERAYDTGNDLLELSCSEVIR